jgi:spermidine/putrescine transport system ATP-binding protein
MSAKVELAGVSADFGSFRAVDRVDVTIREGEFFSFLGPSGCGKTTILRMISGFVDPSEGQIRIGGQVMRGIGPNRRPTALIFQNLALFPLMTVWENIAFGLEVRGASKQARRERAEELLKLVDLPGAGDKAIGQLSGGQKQRVAIARALAVEPKVMLLDEPLSALDLKLRQHMRAELRAIQKRTNVTFIYITHDQGEALAMSDRVGVMSHGKLQQVATPQEIYNRPANGFVASFVGENNVFTGAMQASDNNMAVYETAHGTFKAIVGEGVRKETPAKLYVRPEHTKLVREPIVGYNMIPVEIEDVAFEGNFFVIAVRSHQGQRFIVESRNEGEAVAMPSGTGWYLAFDPQHAMILADGALAEGTVAELLQ